MRSTPWSRRPLVRLALLLGQRFIPLRGTGNSAFLQNMDVIRAAARRLGAELAGTALDDSEDVVMLTLDELLDTAAVDHRALVAERRSLHEQYRYMDLPSVWEGDPEPVAPPSRGAEPAADGQLIQGVAASPGVVEATVRVAHDPGDCAIEPGEILVAHDTDPGWASLMFVSGGLIVDIGGVMSHTGVVARELGLPCVVSTGNATGVLRTGDRVRLDGAAGLIHLLPPEHVTSERAD